MLVWQAPTRAMNPTVPQSIIDNAFEEDPAAAAAEYGAEFRTMSKHSLPRKLSMPVSSPVVSSCRRSLVPSTSHS